MLLRELLEKHGPMIWKYHEHDSLLENQTDENLSKEERANAWTEYENEQKGIMPFGGGFGGHGRTMFPQMYQSSYKVPQHDPAYENVIKEQYRKQYPHLNNEQLIQISKAYILEERKKKY